jgi:hypothetical protein
MNILLGDLMQKLMKKIFSHQQLGMRLHEIGNCNGAKLVSFATSEYPTVKSTMCPHRNVH